MALAEGEAATLLVRAVEAVVAGALVLLTGAIQLEAAAATAAAVAAAEIPPASAALAVRPTA